MAIVGFIKWRNKPTNNITPKQLKRIIKQFERTLGIKLSEWQKDFFLKYYSATQKSKPNKISKAPQQLVEWLQNCLSEFIERKSKKNYELALGRPIKKIKQIEKALGFKLTEWQKAFIFEGQPYGYEIAVLRINGKTTAHCLRACLSEGQALVANVYGRDLQQFYGEDGINYRRRNLFISELQNIYETLNNAGIETRKIIFIGTERQT